GSDIWSEAVAVLRALGERAGMITLQGASHWMHYQWWPSAVWFSLLPQRASYVEGLVQQEAPGPPNVAPSTAGIWGYGPGGSTTHYDPVTGVTVTILPNQPIDPSGPI
ncbi:MAG: hypothetical protein ACRDGM_11850, partial [bacterium]